MLFFIILCLIASIAGLISVWFVGPSLKGIFISYIANAILVIIYAIGSITGEIINIDSSSFLGGQLSTSYSINQSEKGKTINRILLIIVTILFVLQIIPRFANTKSIINKIIYSRSEKFYTQVNDKLYYIVGKNDLKLKLIQNSIEINSDSLEQIIYIDIEIFNSSNDTGEFYYSNDTLFISPTVYASNDIIIPSGFSFGIFDIQSHSQIHSEFHKKKPSPPTNIKEIENLFSETGKEKIRINPNKSFKFSIPIKLKEETEYYLDSFNLERDQSYLLKVYLNPLDISSRTSLDKLKQKNGFINCYISNGIQINIR